ncbi:MAG: dihydroneopterin aldolase [Proteobacteria bacterium]|nr:dihydroneopterin aldolase [Pseudomonadota bacterium]
MDKIIISDIKLNTLIGIKAWEKQTPQNLHLDLVMATDAKRAAENDDIKDAIDYENVLQHILVFIQEHHFQLLETLAEHLADELLTHFATAWVQITLHKPGALAQAKNVAITIERQK